MITADQLGTVARQLGVRLDFVEKDYVNSWILWGVYTSEYGENLVFKGGTALSKLYFPETWRFSEDLDFGVEGRYTGSEEQLRAALNTVSERSGIGFTIREHHESRQHPRPTHYVDVSVRYDAVLDRANTTSLDVMIDEHIASDPVTRVHEFLDVPEFELRAYSVAEIFAEKLRAIFQRGAPRDYYDLYQLLKTDSLDVDPGEIFPAFEAKCDHDGLEVDLRNGLPEDERVSLQNGWETTMPDLTSAPPSFDDVWSALDDFVTKSN